MLFAHTDFLFLFLPALFTAYFLIPQGRDGRRLWWKNTVLLLFSLLFYSFNGLRALGILLTSILLNYVGGLLVSLQKPVRFRRGLLVLILLANFGILGWYKYAGFALEIANALGASAVIPRIVLPAGISFFTFQGVSYVIDVYRGSAPVQKNPVKVALYIALFPQLVAGPIVRYTTVERALTARVHTLADFSYGVERFMLGFGKKMILANAMAQVADPLFSAQPGGLSTACAWVGAVAYTFQIYFDFSAYSDMAIGLGRMFGFTFEENFRYPYMASSITEFWRRWHISLSAWFRDYVYIPLGGNRCSRARNIANLMVVWALTGLWHGANWTFLLWGICFGLMLVAEKYLLADVLPKIPKVLRHLITLLLVILSWVVFRSDSIGDALHYLGVMFGSGGAAGGEPAFYYLRQYLPEWILCLTAIFPVGGMARHALEKLPGRGGLVMQSLLPRAFAVAVFALGYLKLVSGSFNPFIYFQF